MEDFSDLGDFGDVISFGDFGVDIFSGLGDFALLSGDLGQPCFRTK